MELIKFNTPPDSSTSREGSTRINYAGFATNSERLFTYDPHTATLLSRTAEIMDYTNGGEAPLEASRFEQIKTSLRQMRMEGVSGWIILEVLMQTVSIFQTYASLYEAVSDSSIRDYLPLNGFFFPLASLYFKGKDLLNNIEAWQRVRGTDGETDAAIKLVGNVASCLIYSIQIFTFISGIKVTMPVQVALNTLTYTASLHGLLSSAYNSNPTEQDDAPPRFVLRP